MNLCVKKQVLCPFSCVESHLEEEMEAERGIRGKPLEDGGKREIGCARGQQYNKQMGPGPQMHLGPQGK